MVIVAVQRIAADEVRHQQWADQAGERARKARQQRLKQLEAREDAIRTGLELLIGEHHRGTQASDVVLRAGLYRHEGVDVTERAVDPALSPLRQRDNPGLLQAACAAAKDGRPPLSRLINRRGAASHLHVAALGVANFRATAGRRPDLADLTNTGKHSWIVILGDPARSQQSRRHVTAGLGRLRDEGLIGLKGLHGRAHQRFDDWELWDEDGSRERYTVPRASLWISADFWLRGWATVLTGPEIATFLMLSHLAAQYGAAHVTTGIFAAPSRREQLFGITKGVYACANELEEFGLLERTTSRQPGRMPAGEKREVDRWRLPKEALKHDAYDTVTEVLRARRTPARMARYDPLNGLEDFFGVGSPLAAAAGTTLNAPVQTAPVQ